MFNSDPTPRPPVSVTVDQEPIAPDWSLEYNGYVAGIEELAVPIRISCEENPDRKVGDRWFTDEEHLEDLVTEAIRMTHEGYQRLEEELSDWLNQVDDFKGVEIIIRHGEPIQFTIYPQIGDQQYYWVFKVTISELMESRIPRIAWADHADRGLRSVYMDHQEYLNQRASTNGNHPKV